MMYLFGWCKPSVLLALLISDHSVFLFGDLVRICCNKHPLAFDACHSTFRPSVQDSQERSKAFLVFLASGHLLYAYKKALTGSSHEGLSITFHNTIIFGFLLNFIS